MTANRERKRTWQILRALAWAQAALIATLAVSLMRGGTAGPAQVPQAAATTTKSLPTPVAPAAPAPAPAREAQADPAMAPLAPAEEVVAAPAGTVLYGRVIDEAGEAITEGGVWFSRPIESKQGEGQHVATLSLSPGHSDFAIAGLTPGTLDYRARVDGHKERRDSIDIPAGLPRLRRDIVLERTWVLTVKILTPEGKPLYAALQEAGKGRPMLSRVEVGAVVTAAPPDGDFPPTPYREIDFGLGRWRSANGIGAGDGPKLPKDVAGVIEIDKKQPLWASAVLRQHVLTSAEVQPGQPEVVLTVALDQLLKDLCTIRGRVVDGASGAPVAKASVGFGDLQSSGSGCTSDEQGRFEVRELRPGLLDVEVRADKRSARHDLVLLQPGQTIDLGDVPVSEYRTIKGRCEGLQGKAGDGRIACTPLDPPTHPALRRHTDSTSIAADGSFMLYLPDGRYLLRAHDAGGAVTEIDTRTLGDEPLVLKLAKEAMLRIDVQSNGEPWELAVFDGGRELYHVGLRDGWKFPLPFLPGDYRVELTDRHGKTQTRQIHLGIDGVDLRVP